MAFAGSRLVDAKYDLTCALKSTTYPMTFFHSYSHIHTPIYMQIAPKKQVKDIFVVGHYQCGGIKAAMEDKAR